MVVPAFDPVEQVDQLASVAEQEDLSSAAYFANHRTAALS